MRDRPIKQIQLLLDGGWDIQELHVNHGMYEIKFRQIGSAPEIHDPQERLRIAKAKFINPRAKFIWTIYCQMKQAIVAQGVANDLERAIDGAKKNLAQLGEKTRSEMLKALAPGLISDEIFEGTPREEIWKEHFAPDAPDEVHRGLLTRQEFDEQYERTNSILNVRITT